MNENPQNPKVKSALRVKIDDIVFIQDLQIRTKVNTDKVEEYRQMIVDGVDFDYVDLFVNSDGQKLLGDGWHRVLATKASGAATIMARVDDSDPKTAYERALDCALRNTHNGLNCTQEDKRRATALALKQWPKGSDRFIARKSGVSPALVAKIREKGFSPNQPRKKKEKPEGVEVAVNTGKPITKPQQVDPVGSLAEVEAAREGLRGNAAPVNSNTARVKQVQQWKDQGFLDFPDIRELFETEEVVPALLPKRPGTVLLVVKNRNDIDLPVEAVRVKGGVLQICITAEAAEAAFRPVEQVA